MQDNQRQHSGIDMARRIVSAARIAKAAAAGGVHGAAVAAAKEAAPFLAKLAIWVLVAPPFPYRGIFCRADTWRSCRHGRLSAL